MTIQWYGHSCFKISTKPDGRGSGEDVVIFTDPFDKSIGLRPPQGKADIVTVSHKHPDHNNSEALKGEPAILDLPGEYSIKGVSITGINSFHDKVQGTQRGMNTIFAIESEGIRFCHLGDLADKLDKKQLEEVNGVDILAIPVGGSGYTLDGKEAKAVVDQIEPKIVLLMHYKIPGVKVKLDDEKNFCKEIGLCPKDKVAKLILKKKDLEEGEMKVVMMEALSS
ncbi:MAG: MBL fold metallo-hydrolase [Candidatus Moranbacteria bacterium]|nr:MBL fold metallo-hydrolase [Candidatus Moranbacteria bacterium]